VLLAEAALCQENVDPVRRLRFRRPRPKLIDVDNPDGDLRGSPVELRLAESEVSASVAEEDLRPNNFRNQNSGSAALDALIATAQREKPAPVPQPQLLEIEEIPTQSPLRLSPVDQQAQFRDPEPNRAQRVRNRGGIPNRRRPRPEGQEADEDSRRRPAGPKEEPVATLERYSHKNDDGSFTFGYVGADGSFREETRGADCITRGKYGYIDPEGVKREYTYTSGLPCEVGEEDLQNIDDLDIDVEDPVDPRERFRQTQNEQLTDAQIPAAARPRRPIQRRPAEEPAVIGEANTFSNFGSGVQRPRVPERSRPTSVRVSQPSGNALQNLQAIASGEPSSQAAPVRPAPTRAPVRIAPRPTQASPRPAAPVNQGTFDFDAELEGFTLNRPSITFEQNKNQAPSSFQSQLSFNQNTGTFQTQLQQNVQGGQQISLSNNNAPSGVVTTAAPQPTPVRTTLANTRPSPQPTTPRPSPTSFPVRVNPSPAPQGSRGVAPSSTFPLGFEPLNVPDIAAVKVNLPPPTPAPIKAAPKPAPTQRPTPAPTQRPIATPTQRPTPAPTQRPSPTPVRITLTEAPRQSQPVRVAAQTPAAPSPATASTPAAPTSPAAPANTFFVFQPFNQQGANAPQPASAPFRTPVNPNAFQIRPAQPRPAQPQPIRPVQPQVQAARPAAPQVPQRVPVPQPAAAQPAPTPQLQFGFSPVPQGQPARPAQPQPARPQPVAQPQRPAPPQFQQRPQVFTAFRGQQAAQVQPRPAPQQARPPPQQFQGRPQQFQQPQLGIPPQLQQQRPGAPQFAQFDSRFAPRPQGQAPGQVQFRPAQFQPGQQSAQFSVFNPAQQLRGA